MVGRGVVHSGEKVVTKRGTGRRQETPGAQCASLVSELWPENFSYPYTSPSSPSGFIDVDRLRFFTRVVGQGTQRIAKIQRSLLINFHSANSQKWAAFACPTSQTGKRSTAARLKAIVSASTTTLHCLMRSCSSSSVNLRLRKSTFRNWSKGGGCRCCVKVSASGQHTSRPRKTTRALTIV